MRTTLTIDDDVAAQLETVRRERHATLKAIVNDALRVGLIELSSSARSTPVRFRTRTLDLGEPLIPNFDNIAEVLAFAEGENFK
jgi:hypothetical protein